MSFFDDASLVTIPSGIKDGVVYSVKPIDGSGDLTFSRGSDIEATRVNANGYIEKAQVNLLLQSNTFSNASWAKTNATLTSGQSGYDGTSDAWKVEATTSGTNPRVVQTLSSSGLQTFSVYAKAGNIDFIALYASGATPIYVFFDLANGTVGTSVGGNEIDATIEAVGNGFYRCSIIFSAAPAEVRIFPATANGTLSNTGGEYIYIQDAQLNYGLVAQTYQETTTAAVVSGITNDMPRLNYDPANPTCPHLILEPSRTNLINHSDWFGGHTLFASNVATNSLTSPEGVLNGSEVRANSGINLSISTANGYTAGASAYVAKNVGTLTASTYTFSTFVKKTDLNLIQLRAADGSDLTGANAAGSIIDLDTYTVVSETNCTTTIEPYALGWYRVSITFTATAATWYVGCWYWNKTSITVDGTQGYGVYGSQLELGSYVSSMVPTYGSSATRTEDACYKTGISSLIGTEGSIFVDFDLLQLDSFGGIVDLATSPASSSTRVLLWENSGNQLQANFGTFGSAISLSSVTIGRHKALITYSASAFKFFVDGVKIGQTTPSTAPTGLSELTFVCSSGGVNFQKKNIHQTLLFTSVLSDAEAITLTSL